MLRPLNEDTVVPGLRTLRVGAGKAAAGCAGAAILQVTGTGVCPSPSSTSTGSARLLQGQ